MLLIVWLIAIPARPTAQSLMYDTMSAKMLTTPRKTETILAKLDKMLLPSATKKFFSPPQFANTKLSPNPAATR